MVRSVYHVTHDINCNRLPTEAANKQNVLMQNCKFVAILVREWLFIWANSYNTHALNKTISWQSFILIVDFLHTGKLFAYKIILYLCIFFLTLYEKLVFLYFKTSGCWGKKHLWTLFVIDRMWIIEKKTYFIPYFHFVSY